MTTFDTAAKDGDVQAFGSQLGQRLREARVRAKMSLRELAKRAEVSPSFISQVELGRAAPSVGTLYAIVSVLGLSLDSLMHGEPLKDLQPEGGDEVDGANGIALPHLGNRAPARVIARPEVGTLPGLQRADKRPELFLDGGVRWERLTPADDPNLQFLRVTYEPGTESCPENRLMTHNGKEYVHILEGRVEIQVAFARQVLGPGDSINFESTTPHRVSNPFDDDCIALWVVVARGDY